MTIATAVIGAGYGDEGKGLATDFFARKFTRDGKAPLVARCNGGSQAGHTVVDGPDRRHIFGHIGSGTFAGSDTYLGSQFIVNPLTLDREMLQMKNFGLRPDVYAHRSCRVTTIYDMALNSLAELARGANRHGSCGLGINETVTRHREGFFLTVEMLEDVDLTWLMLKRIRKEWIQDRLPELGVFTHTFDNVSDVIRAQAKLYYDMFDLDTLSLALELKKNAVHLQLKDPKIFIDHSQHMIIEGAQGLQIDEFLGEFPHVTRSVTGLPAAIQAANECGYAKVQPTYVTRAYQTRHGAGPLAYEDATITGKALYDDTNVVNEWQGTLRYAPLNVDRLKHFMSEDMARGRTYAQVTSTDIGIPSLFVTCMDQMSDSMSIIMEEKLQAIATNRLVETLEDFLGVMVFYTSHGPVASYVQPTVPGL